MKTSLVILNWNGENFLREYLPSVIKYTLNTDTEVVVADNNSSDNSLLLLKNDFKEVKVIKLDKNYGFALGYNKALAQITDSEYFVLCNSDVLLKSDAVGPIIKLMDSDKEIAACCPKIKSLKNPEMFEYAGAAGGFIDKYGYPFCKGRILNNLEQDLGQYNENSQVFWASGAFLVIRSDVFKKIGGFDEEFFAHMEEIDLCWRVKNQGYKIMYCADSEVFHLGGGTLEQGNPRKLFLNYRNSLKMLMKNLAPQKLFPTLYLRMCLDGLSAGVYLLQGKFSYFWAVFKAHLAFYGNFFKLLKQRKLLKKEVKTYKHKEIYNSSIVFQCLVKKRKKYFELKNVK
ncbi:MAG: glycosyltransferase family 2 protein [Bacteroidales bacterium]|nr:glycosyltransferase family 2 protein [Bacteroidales bacterium]